MHSRIAYPTDEEKPAKASAENQATA